MIPIQLTIEGLYSYQERTVIDFTQLTRNKVFGIFGPVGSGKSAILEAITFALYGETERMGSRGRNYNMMNLRSQRLYIEFIFAMDKPEDGPRYRFTVESTRNSKNFEDVRTYNRQGYLWQTNEKGDSEWVPLPSNDAGHILGLTYQNFTKTIIVPQGKFKEFLHATLSDKERNSLLEELFHLQQYDLAGPTKLLLAQTRSDLEGVRGQLMEVPEVSAEEIKGKEEELENKRAAAENLAESIGKLGEKKQEMDQIKDLLANLNEIAEVLGEIEPDEAEFDRRAQELERYQAADQQFRYELAEQERLQKESTKLEEDHRRLSQAQTAAADQLKVAQQQLEEAERRYEQRQQLLERAGEMESMRKMQGLVHEEKGLHRQVKVDQVGLEEQEKELRAWELQLKEVEGKRDAHQAQLVEMEGLRNVQEWFQEQARRVQNAREKQDYLEQKTQEAAAIRSQVQHRLDQESLPGSPSDIAPALAELRSRTADSEATEKRLASEQADLRLNTRLAEFAAGLQPGDPCPLCGATDHPDRFEAHKADAQLQELAAAIENHRQQRKKWAQAEADIQSQSERFAGLHSEQSQAEAAHQTAQEQLKTHREAFHWPDFSPEDPEAVAAAVQTGQMLKEELEALDQEARQLRQTLDEGRVQLRQAEKDLSEARNELAGLQARRNTLQEGLDHYQWEDFAEQEPSQLDLRAREFRTEHQARVSDYQAARQAAETVQVRAAELTQATTANQTRREETRQQIDRNEDQLMERLAAGTFDDLDEIRAVLETELDVADEKEKIEGFRKTLARLRNEREQKTKELAGRSFDPAELEALEAKLEAQKAQKTQFDQDLGALKQDLVGMRQALEKRTELLAREQQLQGRSDNLGTIAKLFKAKGFVKYVSTQRLHELARRANQRFMGLTQNQLSLELDDDNAFRVRDLLNDGHYRHIKTLSGGQTFQAALSLALALADTIQHQSGSTHNFFFLDEGFGTLDKEALSIVFGALQQLREEQRVVGVISHVEELQQEISVSLRVWKDDEKGSQVKGSWE